MITIKNSSGAIIPANSFVMITGFSEIDHAFTVDQPDADDVTANIAVVNSSIAIGKLGKAQIDGVAVVTVKSGETVAAEDSVAAASGAWGCKAADDGYTVLAMVSGKAVIRLGGGGGAAVNYKFLTVTAVGTNTLTCEDADSNSYTVYCDIKGGSSGNSLANASPFIEVGDPVLAAYDSNESKWRYPSQFQAVRSVLA